MLSDSNSMVILELEYSRGYTLRHLRGKNGAWKSVAIDTHQDQTGFFAAYFRNFAFGAHKYLICSEMCILPLRTQNHTSSEWISQPRGANFYELCQALS